MENQIKCPVCGIDFIHIKGCVQGLSEDGLSVDIHYYCENDHNFVKTFYSENGGHWEKTEDNK